MYQILLVEDDRALALAVQKLLESYGSRVRCVEDFADVLGEFAACQPQLVLMDIKLPYRDGYYWCSRIREISAVPVVFLSSASDNMNIVMALNMGGDDFIAKPVDPMVLTAKVQAVLRRTYEIAGAGQTVEFCGATLSLGDGCLHTEKGRVELTKNEFRILQLLLENRGKIVSREELMMRLWQSDLYVEENTHPDGKCGEAAEKAGGGRPGGRDPHEAGQGVHHSMKKGRRGAVLGDCLRKNRVAILLWVLTVLTEWVVFYLYRIMWEPLLYAGVLTLAVGLLLLGLDLRREMQAARERLRLREAILTEWNNLPEERTLEQADYGDMIRSLGRQLRQETAAQEAQRQDMLDYYTTWVHQIKTPMAVMKLYLGAESPEHRAMGAELFRMEQYVDMVLQYLRLDGGENDLVITRCDLDELIREAVRRYGPQFVLRKLSLHYEPTERTVVTDRKWFVCILEQLLSNAIKYTPEGCITIRLEGDCLHISDTGIGIAPEDLPRIFEKGYTGENGRLERTSSGLGLYLAGKAAALLHIPITVDSSPGQGTTFTLHLRQEE